MGPCAVFQISVCLFLHEDIHIIAGVCSIVIAPRDSVDSQVCECNNSRGESPTSGLQRVKKSREEETEHGVIS